MRTLIIVGLLLTTAACFAQTGAAPSVVVGQNAEGQPVVVQIIPLKYLDPVVAADILTALGFAGTVIPVNPPHRPGESPGAYQSQGTVYGQNRPNGRNNSRYGNSDRGYDGSGQDNGYQGSRNTGGTNRTSGGQSPYGYR